MSLHSARHPRKWVSVRLAARGGRQVRAELEGVGEAGSRGSGRLRRECVFAGTVNPDTCLRDETGNCLRGPLRCGAIDIAALARDRDRLCLRWLDPADTRLLWHRANRRPWKPICWEPGIGRATANRRWQYGIAVIVSRLNGRRVPKKRSMESVIGRAG